MQTRPFLFALSGAFFSLAATVTLASRAHADLTVVSETTVSGIPAAAQAMGPIPDMSKPITSTTYYKGDKVRTEAAGSVILTGADGQITTINTAAKTYSVSSPASMAANPFASMMSFSATGSKVTKTDEKKTILGKNAGKYTLNIPMRMSMGEEDPAGEGLLTIKIAGEEWTTDAVTLPTAATGMGSSAIGKLMMGPMSGGMKTMAKQMAEIKGLPLLTILTMNFVIPDGSPAAAAFGDGPPPKITMRTEVKSLSEDALADTLFTVPADYKKVDATPMIPGLPGGPPPAAPATPTTPAAPATAPAPSATP